MTQEGNKILEELIELERNKILEGLIELGLDNKMSNSMFDILNIDTILYTCSVIFVTSYLLFSIVVIIVFVVRCLLFIMDLVYKKCVLQEEILSSSSMETFINQTWNNNNSIPNSYNEYLSASGMVNFDQYINEIDKIRNNKIKYNYEYGYPFPFEYINHLEKLRGNIIETYINEIETDYKV